MRVIIDRFEGEHAVVEICCGGTADMPRVILPEDAKEGDVLEINILREESDKRREEIERLMDSVWEV
ncbi:MAG: DUF3006 domain-containing protein [Eubacteriales bacterium]|nr:DUF3006 domain-containing protein [Eubacteriales bacterium]